VSEKRSKQMEEGGDVERLRHEPHWPAAVALLAVGGLSMALPPSIAVGPRWLLLVMVTALVIPAVITFHRHPGVNRVLGHCLAGLITFFMVWSLVLLVQALPTHAEPPMILLRSAACLWATNVVVFAYWYWRLDAGGPHSRAKRDEHTEGAFLFPQMAMPQAAEKTGKAWSPWFIDYLFLAFNTSAAFSPTDTPVLSRWAKVLTMMQAAIALGITLLLAARVVNIL